ncbi:adenylate/guanylate cyclase domain-containing protein [Limibaculum sp. M0105]|uniref:Adenylate/guanylate cyclase domain-containing protein n=1 Tax=Thermohalobaculum xanthum TaxID=2753746 RepID=A0A8J7M7E4_9RHOB|nr:adenylate/guanylate cyclase domain-containing protein [Thermohalobaculum xanthum]MBK0398919.1 adenylate/guanylate cyclase domain-containing protein [Thermohalobaculum xanthum]
MSITAINERLLRAIGVGVAIARERDLKLIFHNGAFAEWFGEPAAGTDAVEALPGLDPAALRASIAEAGRFDGEITIKPKRRTLSIALAVSPAEAEGERLLVIECQNVTRIRELESMIDSYSSMVERNTRELEREKERVERLLLNIMPRSVYEEFKSFGVVTPQLYPSVSVLMLDFVGFTAFAAQTDPTVTLHELNDVFTAFDRISEQYGCERIKTIGDAYMAVAGMPEPSPDHARAVTQCAIRFIRYLERRNQSHPHKWEARIGLGTGAAVGSVVGIQKYVYDVFGPAVNMAARLQAFASPMSIVAPDEMKTALIDDFSLTDLGMHEIRGLGEMRLMRVGPGAETARRHTTV